MTSDDRRPRLIGIVHLWIRGVEILGYASRPNEYIPAGTVGDMEVIETSNDARVIQARFHPGGEGHGFGLVTNPEWGYVPQPSTPVPPPAEEVPGAIAERRASGIAEAVFARWKQYADSRPGNAWTHDAGQELIKLIAEAVSCERDAARALRGGR